MGQLFSRFLKSPKARIAWKLSDIKGVNPEFCYYKISNGRGTTNICEKSEKALGKPVHCRNEVDRAKVEVIAKLPHPTSVKECIESFNTLKRKLTEAPILIAPDWDLPFELMCDASDFAIGAVLGQRKNKHFQTIHLLARLLTEAHIITLRPKKHLLAVVDGFENIRSLSCMSKSLVYTDHSAIKYLFAKMDAKADSCGRIIMPQEFDYEFETKKVQKILVQIIFQDMEKSSPR
ncbi:reverse transcriptase domain-containing protein [Tanacetum coccineum]|uniref:Reverse transcriptase domain-containing protein n=1 Tax=Tanacetum coccineum TaxID=301880 RepID=A0ABQ5C6I7_9ASTR